MRRLSGLNAYQASKIKNGKCISTRCANKAPKNKRRCHKCIKENFRKRNPIRYYYDNLKTNAKKKDKTVEITFEDFKKFVVEKKFFSESGKKLKLNGSIDRKDNSIRVYRLDNIQVLSLAENTRKQYVPYWQEQNQDENYY